MHTNCALEPLRATPLDSSGAQLLQVRASSPLAQVSRRPAADNRADPLNSHSRDSPDWHLSALLAASNLPAASREPPPLTCWPRTSGRLSAANSSSWTKRSLGLLLYIMLLDRALVEAESVYSSVASSFSPERLVHLRARTRTGEHLQRISSRAKLLSVSYPLYLSAARSPVCTKLRRAEVRSTAKRVVVELPGQRPSGQRVERVA